MKNLRIFNDESFYRSLRLRYFSASLQNLRAEKHHENRWAYIIYRAFQGVSVLTAEFALLGKFLCSLPKHAEGGARTRDLQIS